MFRSMSILTGGLCLVTALTLSGCGGSDKPSQVAAGSGGGAAGSPSVDTDQLVGFAQCLRRHGLDVPDPKPGQNLGTWVQGWAQKTGTSLRNSSAAKECQSKLPTGIRDRMNNPETQDELLKFAQCMRQNGVDMPDPKNGKVDFGSVDRGSPQFTKAAGECRKNLNLGGGLGGK
jgi:hypothetical protein